MNLGEVLKSARESAHLSLDDLASQTSIRAGLLSEMEKNNFLHCGGDIYAKGHLRNIAPKIGLNPNELIDLFNAEHSTAARSINDSLAENSVTSVPHERRSISWKVPAAISVTILLVLAVVQIVITNIGTPEIKTPQVATASESPSPSASPSVISVNESGTVTMEIVAARGSSRIDIVVDGQHVDKGSIFQGETKTFEATTSISIYFSNPAGLDVTVNGELLAPLGGENQEVRRTFR